MDDLDSKNFWAVGQANALPLNMLEATRKISQKVLFWSILFLIARLAFYLVPKEATVSLLNILPFKIPSIGPTLFSGIAAITFSFWTASALIVGFARQKLMNLGKDLSDKTDFGPKDELLEHLDFDAAKATKWALQRPHLPFQKVLLYRILRTRRLSFAFHRLMISDDELEKQLLTHMKENARQYKTGPNPAMDQHNKTMRGYILDRAARLALDNGEQKISVFMLFLAVADYDEALQAMMDRLQLLNEDIVSVVLWQLRMENYRNFRARFWEKDNLRRAFATSPAAAAIGGYTVLLDRYARDISLTNPLRLGGVVLHQHEIDLLKEALIKQTGNGVLLVGESGSGRKSVIYNFANQIASENGPKALKKARILELDMVAAIGNNPNKADLTKTLERIFQEAVLAKNVVLVIPEIHSYLGKGFGTDSVTSTDIGAVLANFLSHPGFRLVGITTYEGLHGSIERASDITAKFHKIEINRTSSEETMSVLKEEGLRREIASGIFIPIATLKEIVKLCDYFLGNEAFPKKAVNLLDDLIANKSNQKTKYEKIILPADVDAYFSQKYQVRAGMAGQNEKEILINLEERIHEELINQKEAVKELADALRRARAEIKKRKRTIGNFLFLGPTGVGKTETAKQLAKVYFGSVKDMVRLNMADYQTVDSVVKLIGDASTPGFLTTAVRENPFSLILIDEIEKAHPGLLNIFLNIFDEGEVNDGLGRSIDFKHAIVIATSNAGAEDIREAINSGRDLTEMKNSLIDTLLRRNIFRPEFINRFDAVVLYRPLKIEEIQQVAELMLHDIKEGLRQKRIELVITPELTQQLGQLGFDPVFGGRAMRRAIQDKIENTLAKAILAEKIKPGDVCEFNCQTWELMIKTDH